MCGLQTIKQSKIFRQKGIALKAASKVNMPKHIEICYNFFEKVEVVVKVNY